MGVAVGVAAVRGQDDEGEGRSPGEAEGRE